MIQRSNKIITEAGTAAILNPITDEGDFLVKSITEEYPRAFRCMQSIANDCLLSLGRLYNYHDITTQPKPEFLINICCSAQVCNGVGLAALEKALFIIATNFASKNYTYKAVAIPEVKSWENNPEKQVIIEKLFSRYFINLKDIKVSYYYA